MTDDETDGVTEHPREGDLNETIDDSPAPDPEQGVTPEDNPQAD